MVAHPNQGSLFTKWSGDCTGTGQCQVTMDEEYGLTATFTKARIRPDALIRRSDQPSFAGGGVYNATGMNQTRTGTTRVGTTVTFVLRFENDGNAVDGLKVKGPASTAAFRVRYLSGLMDVTATVVNGTFVAPNMRVGGSVSLKLQITPRAGAVPGSSRSVLVVARSVADGTKVDAVKAVVMVKAA